MVPQYSVQHSDYSSGCPAAWRPSSPVDNFENHAAPDHFGFEIGGVLLPIGRLSNTESGPLAEGNKFIIGFEGTADALVHHGEAIVCKSLIVHRELH